MQENNSVTNTSPSESVYPSVTTPQPVYEKPKTNNFLVILLSVLLFVAVSIAGFFAYQTQKLVNELRVMSDDSKQTAQKTTEPVAEPVATVDPIADWKMYTGKIFTFKYPSDMSIKRQDIQDADDPKNTGDLVELSNNQYKLQVSSNFMGGWGGSVCLVTKDQKIDGHDSQLLYFRDSKPGTEVCLDHYIDLVALIEHQKFTHPYPILVELRPKKDNGIVDLELFDQILSTFKFTN